MGRGAQGAAIPTHTPEQIHRTLPSVRSTSPVGPENRRPENFFRELTRGFFGNCAGWSPTQGGGPTSETRCRGKIPLRAVDLDGSIRPDSCVSTAGRSTGSVRLAGCSSSRFGHRKDHASESSPDWADWMTPGVWGSRGPPERWPAMSQSGTVPSGCFRRT